MVPILTVRIWPALQRPDLMTPELDRSFFVLFFPPFDQMAFGVVPFSTLFSTARPRQKTPVILKISPCRINASLWPADMFRCFMTKPK